jgi:hypothetical protein
MADLHQPCPLKGKGLSLSGDALIELMKAVHAKNLPFRFHAEGFSMSPFLKDGDIITVSPLGESILCRGDIVAFVHPLTKKPVVHRIMLKEGGFLKIRGDSASSDDGLIPEANILGRVTTVERCGKKKYLGLGPEKYLIALLSDRSLLTGLLSKLSGIRNAVRSKFKRGLA